MRHGLRWVATLLVLALMLPAAAGAGSAPRTGASPGWNPWGSLVALVSALFGGRDGASGPHPDIETGCGIDGTGVPKCTS
jgi:hypothetical protein